MFHNGDLMDVENDLGTMGSVPYKYKCQALQKDNCPSVVPGTKILLQCVEE